MDLQRVQEHILKSIPILEKLGVTFEKIQPDLCRVKVSLAPNRNHKNTAFGGSIYSACAAACYGVLYWHQDAEKIFDKDIVIANGNVQYLKGVTTDFSVEATLTGSELQKLQKLRNYSKSPRLMVKAVVSNDKGLECARFEGEFAFVSK